MGLLPHRYHPTTTESLDMSFDRRFLVSFLLGLGLAVLASRELLSAEDATSELQAYDARITKADRDHWSYQPVRRTEVPEVRNNDWVRTPIDSFVLALLEENGWKPNPPAKPHDLLRRLYLDLVGLPPTIEEQDRFLSDPSPERFDEEAARLFRRPAYGERWARHWLDLVRYAESNGYERDAAKPHVWRYRDYVIDALNKDKPYDRFVLEQLAGDELPDASAETILATGFYRLGSWDDEPADPAQDRHDQLDDIIRTTSQVFLGLSMGCAKCHDHKFDALTMHDYYRLSAIFAPMQRPQSGRSDLDSPAGSPEQLAILAERDRRIEELRIQQRRVRDSFHDEFLASNKSKLPADVQDAFRTAADKRSDAQKKLAADNQAKLDEEIVANLPSRRRSRFDQAEQQIAQLRQQVPDLPRGYFLIEKAEPPPKSFLLLRGRAATPGPEVQSGLPAVLVSAQPAFEKRDTTSGRRLTLARWIASSGHPLTARVIVNRVWQYHFGEGIVRTPSDFGVMGDAPTHPELLDWLAHWFVHDADWSLKDLHQLILRSNTYRMSKSWNDKYGEADPENRRLWRFPYRRLQVEAIRDSMLASSGRLNRKMHGAGVQLDIPRVVIEGHADRDKIWHPSSEEEQSRRTVYAFVKRSLVVPMLEVLDLCDTTRSTARRNITSVAPQALTLFNGDFVNRQASHLAERVAAEVGDDSAAQIEQAWRHALCRRPTDAERATMLEFLEREAERLVGEAAAGEDMTADDARRLALAQLCRVIYNLNEFAYPN
ncbi:MAG: hypothetical protein CMJ64_27555 [Planctomycetaceae bacterium]|nr:hypothetical protein [Planctomycetaceae bacterium]